jgi:hypothetical protein
MKIVRFQEKGYKFRMDEWMKQSTAINPAIYLAITQWRWNVRCSRLSELSSVECLFTRPIEPPLQESNEAPECDPLHLHRIQFVFISTNIYRGFKFRAHLLMVNVDLMIILA